MRIRPWFGGNHCSWDSLLSPAYISGHQALCINRGLQSCLPWVAGEGLLSHGDVISHSLQLVRWAGIVGQGECHVHGLLGFKNAPNNTSRAWRETGMRGCSVSPTHEVSLTVTPLLLPSMQWDQTHCLELLSLWKEKRMPAPVRRAIFVVSQLLYPTLIRQCGQRCMKMQTNQGELWPSSASKVEITIKSGSVEVWTDSSAVFHPHTSELHICFCNRHCERGSMQSQQQPQAASETGLFFWQ